MVFGKPGQSTEKKLAHHSQINLYDLELLLSLLVINQEIFHRSNIGYGSTIETAFYHFINWSIQQTLAPSIVNDQKGLAEIFCNDVLTEGDTIITFNYDLLLDIALYRSALWFPIYKKNKDYLCGYWNRELCLIGKPMFDKSIFDCLDKLAGNNRVEYIKIHGSTNWFYTENSYDLDIHSQQARDLSKLFDPVTGICHFDEKLKINQNYYILERGYEKVINELCILKPTLGKQYLKFPFSELTKKSIRAISEASELFLIGYSLPLYDTLSEFFILNTNPNCKITIVNSGEEAHKIEERIFKGNDIDWKQIVVFDDGLESWLKGK